MANDLYVVDDYNNVKIPVEAGEYDYVLSFFKRHMDAEAAKNFTSSIYQVAQQAKIPVIEVVDSLKGQSGLEMTASLAYYLNGTRSNSTMLGIINKVNPNFYAGRSVLS